jgi:transposase
MQGTQMQAAEYFIVSQSTVQKLWKRYQDCDEDIDAALVTNHKNCGQKCMYDYEKLVSKAEKVPDLDWQTQEDLAEALGVSIDNVCLLLKKGKLQYKACITKPFIMDENKAARLKYCYNCHSTINKPYYNGSYKVMHLDEKWFYLCPL